MNRIMRDKLGKLLGRKPPQMQVAALCRDAQGQVLLVTSRDTGRWILPKGWPMAGRSLAEAAAQEAWEEAGVRGSVEQAEIGTYHYDKLQDRGFAIPVQVRVYAMSVDELAERYPESKERKRRWFAPARAAEMVAEVGLQALLRRLPFSGPQPRPGDGQAG
ncbi:NUDIX domain-containing protein [Paracoccus limosus]|jgi:8-oxo-dGTP pyrophosphatase MutT (NUDIX family)|uniref:NUDIX domain-containing protein n=2 Tax=Paracoccus limosus TaxID=913252 RepID=A0A844GXQ9_9RHOB|nr:NUDIX domain-containing protein [Paracoccus limosus]